MIKHKVAGKMPAFRIEGRTHFVPYVRKLICGVRKIEEVRQNHFFKKLKVIKILIFFLIILS
jgi:hypothetical protein